MTSASAKTGPTHLALGETPGRTERPRVVVTGGSGKLGRATTQYLADQGWEVINFDTRRPPGAAEDGKTGLSGSYRLVEVDLTNMGEVLEALLEVDMAYKSIQAIVHLAALPSPGQTASSKQFNVNISSTYNILEAARKLNITNVVLASSETLIGIPLVQPPEQLPITEESPRKPESAYSLSKLMGEHLADQYAAWCPKSKYISLRFSNVMLQEEYANFEGWQKDPMARNWNCWGYIDARDGASAIEAALQSKMQGHHAYLVANNNTCMRTKNEDLIKAAFPKAKYTPVGDDPNQTLLSIEKAKRELGWKPKHDWK